MKKPSDENHQLLSDFRALGRTDRAAILALLPELARREIKALTSQRKGTRQAKMPNNIQHDIFRSDLATFLKERLKTNSEGGEEWVMTNEARALLRSCALVVGSTADSAQVQPSLCQKISRIFSRRERSS